MDISKLPSYVISIKSPDEANKKVNYLKDYGFSKTIHFPGVIGKNLDIDNTTPPISMYTKKLLKKQVQRSRHDELYNMGGLGCYLSHYNIWKDIINKGYEWAIIFEDDVYFKSSKSNIKNIIDKSFDDIYDLKLNESPLVLFIGFAFTSPHSNTKLTDNLNIINNFAWGTSSYIINNAAAQQYISDIVQIEHQIDGFMSLDENVTRLSTNKIIGFQNPHSGDIQEMCFNCNTCSGYGTGGNFHILVAIIFVTTLVIILCYFKLFK